MKNILKLHNQKHTQTLNPKPYTQMELVDSSEYFGVTMYVQWLEWQNSDLDKQWANSLQNHPDPKP